MTEAKKYVSSPRAHLFVLNKTLEGSDARFAAELHEDQWAVYGCAWFIPDRLDQTYVLSAPAYTRDFVAALTNVNAAVELFPSADRDE